MNAHVSPSSLVRDILHFHLFCGLGGGAKGFNRGHARVGNVTARFRCLGGIDNDPAAIKDFSRAADAPGTLLDLFSREQYRDFHGHEPPADWREATTADIHAAAGHERPHIVFLSAPCKGFSGLLSETKSKTTRYVALNALCLRGIWLMLEAWKDDPPELVILENVPRIQSRGRPLLDKINALLSHYGYAVAQTTHDCGELGGLAQSRKRFLLVARHMAKVPPFLYEPEKRTLQSVGSILGRMPLPGDIAAAGPMHRIPSLQWKTWVRLAFVEAGCDWRSLNRLAVEDGMLRDYCIMPESQWDNSLQLGVNAWDDHAGAIAGRSRPGNGRFSVADPRCLTHQEYAQFGIKRFEDTASTVTSQRAPGQGPISVADPRCRDIRHNNVFRVVRNEDHACAVTAGTGPSAGGQAVADPRAATGFRGKGKYRVASFEGSTGTVISASTTGQGSFAVADPRHTNWHPGASSAKERVTRWGEDAYTITGAQQVASGALSVADPRILGRQKGDDYLTGGHYGVLRMQDFSGAVSAAACHDNGRWAVADHRLPAANDNIVCVIRALDGTWHRPFTTLELAALQSLVEPEEYLELEGLSDTAWRERIGNAVPPKAAEAIAGVMGTTLLLAWSGATFMLNTMPIWVRPIAIGLSVRAP